MSPRAHFFVYRRPWGVHADLTSKLQREQTTGTPPFHDDDGELDNKPPRRRRAFGKRPPALRKSKENPGRPSVGARGGGPGNPAVPVRQSTRLGSCSERSGRGAKNQVFFLIARCHRIQPPTSQAGVGFRLQVGGSKPRLVSITSDPTRTKVTAKERKDRRPGVSPCQ